jgi:hypothetical protein
MGQKQSSAAFAASGQLANNIGHPVSHDVHQDPALIGMPSVDPGLFADRGGEHHSTLLVKDGRGEDIRPRMDHLTGAPPEHDVNGHSIPLNPRYLANHKIAKQGGYLRAM